MIPHIIHYCWFGKGQVPSAVKACIETWKKNCPNYKIMEWSEENFDIRCNTYVSEAYDRKKYAFVADYARLYALKTYGGIYLDTDVEVRKSLDEFLDYHFVVGFESIERVATAIIMAEKECATIEEWLDSYKERKYIVDEKADDTTNVVWLTSKLLQQGLILNGKRQILEGGKTIVFEKNVFCPYSVGDKKKTYADSYTIHWCDGSWVTGKNKWKLNAIRALKFVIGTENYEKIRRKVKKLWAQRRKHSL